MHLHGPMDNPRQPVLPRFSRLPQTKAASPPPELEPAFEASAIPRSSVAANGQASKRSSIAVFRPSSVSSIRPPTSTSTLPQRQPLGQTSRPQSLANASFDYKSYNASRIGSRHSSQEENEYTSVSGSEASDTSPTATSRSSVLSSPKGLRRPRPSLSDRTMDNLSHLGTPASVRRRSSFFNPQSPMTVMQPERPPSAARKYPPVSKLNYGIPKSATSTNPASPVKKTTAGIPTPTTAKRNSVSIPSTSINKQLPQSGLKTPSKLTRPGMTGPSHVRANSALPSLGNNAQSKPVRKSTLQNEKPEHKKPELKKPEFKKPARPMSMLQAPSATPITSKMQKPQTSTIKRPASSYTPKKPVLKRSDDESSDKSDSPPSDAKSSFALREQIARARAAHLKATAKRLELSPTDDLSLEGCDDPFNQKRLDDGLGPLRQRIDAARRDGRLNIAGMSLENIPSEVLEMYDSAAMEKSSIAWNECVDLIRFNAADNNIKDISDDVFPDRTGDELAAMGKSLQFGGVEVVDLHGNSLNKLPLGLRRLERLDSLNLSRNQLDNGVFEVLSQIPTLRHLNLSNNNISGTLPESIALLHQLESLDLSGNKITQLPAALYELKHLRTLKLSSNRLHTVDMDLMVKLPLKELYMSHNALTGALFPFSVTSVPKLEVLEVSHNSIASLSFVPLSLPDLKQLNVSSNRMMMFPDVSTWKKLINLIAEENELSAFPEGLTTLTSQVKSINLQRNNIRRIDENTKQMDALDTLSMGGNPLLPRKYLTMDCAAIKRDLAQMAVAAPAPKDFASSQQAVQVEES